jgi:predicted DNA-binding protein with PD1-like motif
MTVATSSSRHLLVRLGEGARLPDALLGALRDEVVLAGWVRASGVLADVQLRAYDPRSGGLATARRIAGPVHAVVIEGSVGLAAGDVSCGLRAVLARETETGVETVAGEIADARVVALEAIVTALDEVAAARALDRSGVWLFDLASVSATAGAARPANAAPAAPPPSPPAAAAAPAPAPAAAATATPAAPPSPQWAEAARASEQAPAPKPAGPRPSPTFTPQALPMRPVKPPAPDVDQIYPDAGDVVEHFAFGRCEVVKSDGDRLHVRLGKDGRIKEISLDMLKVTSLATEDGQTTKHFRLDRKL